MSWTSYLHNPEGVSAVYGGVPPELCGVRVHEVILHEDGPTLKLRLDLPRYPERPPRKWAAQGFNTVQVEVALSGLRVIALEGFGTEIEADISLSGENGVTLNLTSPETRVHAVADTAYISKLTAYINEA
ncbi:Imm50 family immunity protein [Streptomyces sp. NPDC101151]|uniref:Imm50 family immunity protein n=1 Tax=Streptomyces sp. NPDC101151 TaxID=3366115 RepID=UPI0038197054